MKENIEPTGDKGEIKAENDFLKMKMMLEKGAEFGSSRDLPPEVENHFLRSVMEYEKQFERGERIKVFDKIGQPRHFRPVKEIPEEEMAKEWEVLYEYMQERGIELSVCSPNVNARELYRFATEELFNIETDKIDMPGMMTCFIYDEFHPDVGYDNSRIAVEECMNYFFDKAAFQDHHYAEKVRLNHHNNLSRAELKYVVQNFKKEYDDLVPVHIKVARCRLNGHHCFVNGFYEAAFMTKGKSELKRGDWMVGFQLDKDAGYWDINEIQIRGIKIH
jgi:hypothetical protein